MPHSNPLLLEKAAQLTEKRAFFAGLALILIALAAFNFLLIATFDDIHIWYSLNLSNQAILKIVFRMAIKVLPVANFVKYKNGAFTYLS